MRDLSELTPKMTANLKKMGADDLEASVLHVGAAEHLIIRGLIRKLDRLPGSSVGGYGRARGLYRLTDAGKAAVAEL